MIFKGKPHEEIAKLSRVTRESMFKAIKVCKPGEFIKSIGKAISEHIDLNGYSQVREFCGHGLGKDVHMEPQILHSSKL